uniref:Laminin G domain-containing protein n=1 Tax=Parascaris univalens TaxID=6257 RepID=A0A915CGL6_PARUN
VHSLNADSDALLISIDVVNASVSNVSTTALTGARLKRIETEMSKLRKSVGDVVGPA